MGARCFALVLYASVHHGWFFLFALLHWLCMFLWLLFQRDTNNSSSGNVAKCENSGLFSGCSVRFVFKSLLLSWPGIVCEVILVTFKLAFLVTLSLTLAVLTYSSYTYLDPSTPQEELISLNVPLNFETCEVTVFPISTFEQNLKLKSKTFFTGH